MPEKLEEEFIKEVYEHWGKKEKLCYACEQFWKACSTSYRREIRHTYEFEEDS